MDTLNQDDIDFDKLFDEELPFKPLTKGLGFHHAPKEEKKLGSLDARKKDLERTLLERASTLKKNSESSLASTSVRAASPNEERDMGDLAPFYAAKVKEELEVKISTEGNTQETLSPAVADGSLFIQRFCAFVVDMAIILSTLVVTFLSFLIASGISLIVIRENLSVEFAMTFALPISLLFYFFYFSFFDKTLFSTPGKKLLGLRLCSTNEQPVKMHQSFLRSLLVLPSILSAGLFSLTDLQGKLTNTKVSAK